MSEILVRVVDNGDSLRGDVIAAMADGHPWSAKERAGDPWVVLAVPDLPLAEAEALCAPGGPLAPPGSGLLPPRKLAGLDLDRLPPSPTAADIRAARVARPCTPDRRHIGPDRRRIG